MIFSFSLYTMPLLVIWVAYFGSELGDLQSREPLEDSKIYYCLI